MIYVCGPMAGLPEHNWPTFKFVTAELRQTIESEVICPTEFNHPDEGKTWEQCLRIDIAQLVRCDEIIYLPGWQNSRGATLEMLVGLVLGYQFHEAHMVNPAEKLLHTRWNYPPTISMLVSAFLRNHFKQLGMVESART